MDCIHKQGKRGRSDDGSMDDDCCVMAAEAPLRCAHVRWREFSRVLARGQAC